MEYDFAASFTRLSGFAHRVDSEQSAAELVARICRDKQARRLALANLSSDLTNRIRQAGPADCTVIADPYPAASLPGAIDAADIGVTGIAFAIAQSGTLVEVSDDDATRLVSSLPNTYIGIVYQEDIIDYYHDGAARVREIIGRHDRNLVISFISGPSRTGDIELKLTLGVHGPEEAHAIIIG